MSNNPYGKSQTIKGLFFENVCLAYPEQYFVYDGDYLVGHVWFRHGRLELYENLRKDPESDSLIAEWNNKGGGLSNLESRIIQGDGYFEDEEERAYFLNRCAEELLKFLENHEEGKGGEK